MAKLASSDEPDGTMEFIKVSSIERIKANPIEIRTLWMTPIVSYLQDGTLPTNLQEAEKLKVRASQFTLIQGILYKRGFFLAYLRCLEQDEANYVLKEVHEGIYGNHLGARSLSQKLV